MSCNNNRNFKIVDFFNRYYVKFAIGQTVYAAEKRTN